MNKSLNAPYSRRAGFSIVMVLVSAALLALLALGFSQVIGDAFKGQKSVQNAVDFDILKTSINMVLNTKACDGAFKDGSGNNIQLSFPAVMSTGTNIILASTPVPVAKILQGNSIVAELGGSLGGGMTLSKLELLDAIYDGDQVVGTPPVMYRAFVATLNVEVSKSAGTFANPRPMRKFSVRLLARPNAGNTAGVVEKCGGTAQLLTQVVSSQSTGNPTAVACPTGMKVLSCTSLLTPQGDLTCGTTPDTDGSSCIVSACTPAQVIRPDGGTTKWSTWAICGRVQ